MDISDPEEFKGAEIQASEECIVVIPNFMNEMTEAQKKLKLHKDETAETQRSEVTCLKPHSYYSYRFLFIYGKMQGGKVEHTTSSTMKKAINFIAPLLALGIIIITSKVIRRNEEPVPLFCIAPGRSGEKEYLQFQKKKALALRLQETTKGSLSKDR
ncbi:hypothetical protein MG293_001845 [Ovis ammon polii]|uniref:Uncharacterized protein n=1 Tax=Ovis ammon polii TaxID=230172 RepID=A0AAD4US37_OVIAM|nr:hypothetical protein MG293_001845 [Ovis ammon polii]